MGSPEIVREERSSQATAFTYHAALPSESEVEVDAQQLGGEPLAKPGRGPG